LIRNEKFGIGRVYLVRALEGLVGLEGGAGWKRRKEGARFRGVWRSAQSEGRSGQVGDREGVRKCSGK
jgi:hypothetical protein